MGEVAPIHEEDDDQPVEGWCIAPINILYVFRFIAVFLIRGILRRTRIRILDRRRIWIIGSVHWIMDPDPDPALFL